MNNTHTEGDPDTIKPRTGESDSRSEQTDGNSSGNTKSTPCDGENTKFSMDKGQLKSGNMDNHVPKQYFRELDRNSNKPDS